MRNIIILVFLGLIALSLGILVGMGTSEFYWRIKYFLSKNTKNTKIPPQFKQTYTLTEFIEKYPNSWQTYQNLLTLHHTHLQLNDIHTCIKLLNFAHKILTSIEYEFWAFNWACSLRQANYLEQSIHFLQELQKKSVWAQPEILYELAQSSQILANQYGSILAEKYAGTKAHQKWQRAQKLQNKK